jgi:exodeoxyribonuclease-3
MKLATWNVNSLKVRLPHLSDWLAQAQPDIVCLQELKTEDAKFPRAELQSAGFESVFSGQKTYNGVAILSRAPLLDAGTGIPGFPDEQRRVVAATVADVRVVCVYCPNGQAVGSEKYARYPKLAVAGDFNVAPEDRDVHDPKAWEGQVHVSEPERAAWRALLDLGLKDAFRLFEQPEKVYSWWDYRMMAFRRNAGLRIDQILVSEPLAKRCTACSIDKGPRKLERPSDHAPVIAEFNG